MDNVFQNGMNRDFFVIFEKDDGRFPRLFQSLLPGAPVVFQDGFQNQLFGVAGKRVPLGADGRLEHLALEPDGAGQEKGTFQPVLGNQHPVHGMHFLLHSPVETLDRFRKRIPLEFGLGSRNPESDDQDTGDDDETCGQKEDPERSGNGAIHALTPVGADMCPVGGQIQEVLVPL